MVPWELQIQDFLAKPVPSLKPVPLSKLLISVKFKLKMLRFSISLVVQWLRISLPV